MDKNKTLEQADYMEPNCPLNEKPVGYERKTERIPQQRISFKLDELMGKKDFSGAERLLKYWLDEALNSGDDQGAFMVLNEMMGYYRKVNKKNEAYDVVDKAIGMLESLGYLNSISGATCYTNAATVYTHFNEFEKSIELFEKAQTIYEQNSKNNEYKLASLYNNMAIGLAGMKKFDQAQQYYDKALQVVKTVENSELEQAMTYLNMLDCLVSEKGNTLEIEEQANEYLSKAQEMLDSPIVERNSYYSYVCDKCVNIFDYFGWFRYAKQLRERIKEIDERA